MQTSSQIITTNKPTSSFLQARQTPLRKPIFRGKVIISTKPRPKSAYDFLVWCIVLLFDCAFGLSPTLHDIFPTPVARYSLFVLRVPLNASQPATRKLSTGPAFPVFGMSSPGDETHCSAMW